MNMVNLEFAEPVQRNFGFLTTEFEFELVESTELLVRYESARVFVTVSFDSLRSYELDVAIGVFDGRERPSFYLSEILRLKGASEEDLYRCIQVTKQAALTAFIDSLADRLRRYGGKFLNGDK